MKGLGHGQVWWADLGDAGIRPVLALTRRTVAPARWPEVCDAMAHTIGCHLD
ncbi:MAG: hypothetical protein ACLGIR_10330 [Actinomycetes bacterium]